VASGARETIGRYMHMIAVTAVIDLGKGVGDSSPISEVFKRCCGALLSHRSASSSRVVPVVLRPFIHEARSMRTRRMLRGQGPCGLI